MSKHDVSVPIETGNTSERVEQFLAGVYALQIPSQIERRERRLYVISGGIFGISLVVVGAALFARYSAARLLRFWLARLVADQQIQTDRVVDAITVLAESMKTQTASADENGH